jgi:hypothetical protein
VEPVKVAVDDAGDSITMLGTQRNFKERIKMFFLYSDF